MSTRNKRMEKILDTVTLANKSDFFRTNLEKMEDGIHDLEEGLDNILYYEKPTPKEKKLQNILTESPRFQPWDESQL